MSSLKHGESVAGTVICRLPDNDGEAPRWALFRYPKRVIETSTTGGIIDALNEIDLLTSNGMSAAGFISCPTDPS